MKIFLECLIEVMYSSHKEQQGEYDIQRIGGAYMSIGTNISLDCFSVQEGITLVGEEALKLSPNSDGYISIKLGNGKDRLGWDNYKYFILEMYVDIDAQALVEIYFEKANSNLSEKPAYILYEMVPKRQVKLVVDLDDLNSKKYFLLTLPGMLKGRIHCEPSSITEMSSVTVRFRPGYSHTFNGVTIDVYKRQAFVLKSALFHLDLLGHPHTIG